MPCFSSLHSTVNNTIIVLGVLTFALQLCLVLYFMRRCWRFDNRVQQAVKHPDAVKKLISETSIVCCCVNVVFECSKKFIIYCYSCLLFSLMHWFKVIFLFFLYLQSPQPSMWTFISSGVIRYLMPLLVHHLQRPQKLKIMNPAQTLCYHLAYPGILSSTKETVILLVFTERK